MEDNKKAKLEEYEHELEILVKNDKNNWAKFYLIMKKVEDEELYKLKNFRSFTSWLKDFSLKNKVHVSVLWNRKKAGKVYEQYQESQKEKGIKTKPIQDINVSMESLVLLDKIQKKAPNLADNLIEKTMNKQVTREDLRSAYKNIRDSEPIKKPTKNLTKESIKKDDPIDVKVIQNKITATTITHLFKDSTWLLDYKVKRKAFRPLEEQDKYLALSEFRLYTGTSKKSRRVDIMILENVTTQFKSHQLHTHGIEIKIDKYDLLNDHKYIEYAEFCHFLWLAVPTNLIPVALETAPPAIGIIEVKEDETLVKVRDSKKGNPLRLLDTFQVAAIKLM